MFSFNKKLSTSHLNYNRENVLNRTIGLATQLALAYAIHKSFIFIRIPLTAAIIPKVVKVLRGWGWDIGKRTTKEAKAIKRSLGGKPATK